MGKQIGYARVSSDEQNLALQIDELKEQITQLEQDKKKESTEIK